MERSIVDGAGVGWRAERCGVGRKTERCDVFERIFVVLWQSRVGEVELEFAGMRITELSLLLNGKEVVEKSSGWLDLHEIRKLCLYDPHHSTSRVELRAQGILQSKLSVDNV